MADNYRMNALNMVAVNTALSSPEGFATDGHYLYVTPHNDYVIAKIDTRTFKIVGQLDLSKVNPSFTAMLGSFIANGFLYILPHLSNSGPTYQSDVVQVDLNNFTPAGVTSLKVFNASQALNALGGYTDGQYGYLNMHVSGAVMVTRFGTGKNFNAASISTVSIPTIAGFKVLAAGLISVDSKAVYCLARVQTNPGTGHNDAQADLWLTTIPTSNFTAQAATSQRLTNLHFVRGGVPIGVDDGTNLWIPPIPISSGPLTGKFVGVMKIPKSNPAAVTISQGPSSQPPPQTMWNAGNGVYDGRYCYIAAYTAAQIIQMDTQNPGVVNLIDISAYTAGYAMFGMGYDGRWAYVSSYNGGGGVCLKFLPTQNQHGGGGNDQGEDDDDQGGSGGQGQQ